MNENNEVISLKVAGVELFFEPTLTAYNQMSNDAAKDSNVIGALRDYLMKIVTPESRDALSKVLLRPGAAAQIAKVVNEIYAPDLEIEVKTSSA